MLNAKRILSKKILGKCETKNERDRVVIRGDPY